LEVFTHLPPQSRVWIYQANREIAQSEAGLIGKEIKDFISQWLAHKAKVTGDGALLYDRFLILAADEEKLQVSGCSIDSTVKFVRETGAKYNINFFDRFYTCYWHGDKVVGCDFDTFKTKMINGEINDDTIVFNNLVTTIKGLNDRWQVPLAESWQKGYAGPSIIPSL
jgi:hypothetical protein